MQNFHRKPDKMFGKFLEVEQKTRKSSFLGSILKRDKQNCWKLRNYDNTTVFICIATVKNFVRTLEFSTMLSKVESF